MATSASLVVSAVPGAVGQALQGETRTPAGLAQRPQVLAVCTAWAEVRTAYARLVRARERAAAAGDHDAIRDLDRAGPGLVVDLSRLAAMFAASN